MLLPETDAPGGGDRRRAARRGGPGAARSSSRRAGGEAIRCDGHRLDRHRGLSRPRRRTGQAGARRRRRRALRGQGGRARHATDRGDRDRVRSRRRGRRGRSPYRRRASRRRGRRVRVPAAARQPGHSRRGRAVADSLATCRSDQRPNDDRRDRPATRAVKAVIPAAGLATRFLPATKAVPKELLPVVDRPVLQYIVEEAAAAGIGDVLLITGRGKTSMVDHFDRQPVPGGAAGGEGRPGAARRGPPAQRAGRDLHLPAGRAARPRPRRRRTPSRTSATSPSRCCSATSSSSRPSRCCRRCSTCRPAPAASCSPSSRSTPDETNRYGIASVEPAEAELTDVGEVRPGDRPGGEAAAGGGAEQPRGPRPVRAARPRSSTRSGAPSRAAAARSS